MTDLDLRLRELEHLDNHTIIAFGIHLVFQGMGMASIGVGGSGPRTHLFGVEGVHFDSVGGLLASAILRTKRECNSRC